MTDPARGPAGKALGGMTLLVLSLVYGVQYLDQILLGLFIQPIKAEFALSDTQVGLLTGAAFTVLYVTLGLPLARLADRGNRKRIVLVSVTVFSIATACSGVTGGFLSLFATRMLVAIGEAGTIPASVSILADTFPSSQRRLAMSLHSCGGFAGTAFGLLTVGLASAVLGWRHIFGVAGLIGLVLALCVALLVREPARVSGPAAPKAFFQDLRELVQIRPYVLLALGMGIGAIASSAAINWIPAFLGRSYAMPQREIVLFLAAAWGIGATAGSVMFGLVTNRLNRAGGARPLLVVAALIFLFAAMCCVSFLTNSAALTLIAFGLALFLMGGIRGPAFATVQDLVAPRCQATANALLMLSMYVIGVTLGPLLTGMVSDALATTFGKEALRHALLVVLGCASITGSLFVVAAAIALSRRSPARLSPRAETCASPAG